MCWRASRSFFGVGIIVVDDRIRVETTGLLWDSCEQRRFGEGEIFGVFAKIRLRGRLTPLRRPPYDDSLRYIVNIWSLLYERSTSIARIVSLILRGTPPNCGHRLRRAKYLFDELLSKGRGPWVSPPFDVIDDCPKYTGRAKPTVLVKILVLDSYGGLLHLSEISSDLTTLVVTRTSVFQSNTPLRSR